MLFHKLGNDAFNRIDQQARDSHTKAKQIIFVHSIN